ncbi:MAG: hypothetical protein H0X17_06800 [Deltaproteobacteria bacterium]|nr:hypothetical protein [Deltaproteobacteria bacterium]
MFAAGCAGELTTGGEGGDDTQIDPNCGDGVVNAGESCDDGNSTSGDGCSATCSTEATADPRVTVALDKTTLTSELGTNQTITLTLTSVDGFTGNVNVVGAALDAASAPVAGLTLMGPESVAVSADGTATAMYMLQVPTNATGVDVAGSLKFDVTSAAGTESVSAALSISAVFNVTTAAGVGANTALHPKQAGTIAPTVTVKRGATIRYTNGDTMAHRTHGSGGVFGHEPIGGGLPGGTYEIRTLAAAPGSTGTLGCHDHSGVNNASYVNFTVQ